jgi:hypothetical protein
LLNQRKLCGSSSYHQTYDITYSHPFTQIHSVAIYLGTIPYTESESDTTGHTCTSTFETTSRDVPRVYSVTAQHVHHQKSYTLFHYQLHSQQSTPMLGYQEGVIGLMVVLRHMTGFTAIEPLREMNSTSFAKSIYSIMLPYGLSQCVITDPDSKLLQSSIQRHHENAEG